MIHAAADNCKWCKHYLKDRKCLSFPEKIPEEFWVGDNLHRNHVSADKGYRFEKLRITLPEIKG